MGDLELLSKCQRVVNATSGGEVEAEGVAVITAAAERAVEAAAAEITAVMTEDAEAVGVTKENAAAHEAVTAEAMVVAEARALVAVVEGAPLPPPPARTHERGLTP